MIYSAQPKIRPFLGIGVAIMLSSLSAFAQSRSEPEGHLSLTVNNGSGSGSEYKPGEEVTVEATPSDGFIFVQWLKISGDGSLENKNAKKTKFIMGEEDAEIVAALAKVETWFPPGPESGKKGLHLPKPKTGQAHRLEQRVRVTLSRGEASHPPFSNIWELVKVKLKWEKVEDINFFD